MASNKKKPKVEDGWVDVAQKSEGSDGWEDAPITDSDQRAYAKGAPYDPGKMISEFPKLATPPEFLLETLAGLGIGATDRATRGNLQAFPGFKGALSESEANSPTATMLGSGAGEAAYGLANLYAPAALPAKLAAIPGASSLARMLMGAGEGAIERPAEGGSRLENAATGAATATGMNTLGGGLRFSGDRLKQLAIGKTKMQPGLGEELIDEFVWAPTREGMKNQVARKKGKIYEKMKQAVVGNPAPYSSLPVQAEVNKVGNSMRIPGTTKASALDQPALDKIDSYVQDIAGRGDEDLAQMLSRRGAAGGKFRDAFNEYQGMGKESLTDAISQAEQRGYSNILKAEAPALKNLDPRYSSLASASQSLNKPRPMYQGMGGVGTMGSAVGGGMYAYTKNPMQALAAAGIGGLMSTPGAQSGLAHILNRTGRAAPVLTPAMINAIIGDMSRKQEAQ
jgi:hypothetical protein